LKDIFQILRALALLHRQHDYSLYLEFSDFYVNQSQRRPEETEITAEEVERQIRNLKKKAAGRDGVQNKAWMYGTEKMVELMNGIWRGERFPVDWREGVICLIF
jgi:hypothetical protein